MHVCIFVSVCMFMCVCGNAARMCVFVCVSVCVADRDYTLYHQHRGGLY
jgi:hypothetical protein